MKSLLRTLSLPSRRRAQPENSPASVEATLAAFAQAPNETVQAAATSADAAVTNNLTSLLSNLDEVFFVLDDANRLIAASRPLLKLLDMPEVAVVGRAVHTLFDGPSGWLAPSARTTVRFRCRKGVGYSAVVGISPVSISVTRIFHVGRLSQVSIDDSAASSSPLPGAPVSQNAVVPPVPENSESAAFSARIKSLLQDVHASGRLTAGRIEVIGMEEVKAALGKRWQAMAAHAKSIARAIIEKRLAPQDLFSESSNDTFIICFSSIGVDEARLKAQMIAREIYQRLLGGDSTPFIVNSQVEKLKLQGVKIEKDTDLVPTLIAMLDEARAQQRKAMERRVSDLLSAATLQLHPIQTRAMQQTGLMIARISSNERRQLADILAGEEDPGIILKQDSLLLGFVVKHLYTRIAEGNAQAIVVPVSFAILRERKYAKDYIDICRSIDQNVRSRILFELHGVTPNLPELRLQDTLACLAPFSAHRLLRIQSLEQRFVNLNRFRLSMLSVHANRSHIDDPNKQRSFREFAAMVHGSGSFIGISGNTGCRLLLYDVEDDTSARWYATNGADFISLAGDGVTAGYLG